MDVIETAVAIGSSFGNLYVPRLLNSECFFLNGNAIPLLGVCTFGSNNSDHVSLAKVWQTLNVDSKSTENANIAIT